jgi:hypothetical protein
VSDSIDNDSQPVPDIVPGAAGTRDPGDRGPPRQHRPTLRLVIIALLCLMLLLLIGVVVVLPDLVAQRVTDEQKPAAPGKT